MLPRIQNTENPVHLTPAWKCALSLLIVAHCAAVFLPPFTFASRSSNGEPSPFAAPLFATFRPYIELMYLNHGYFFFAPNPGPAHLVRYEASYDDASKNKTSQFPDRTEQAPRLRYHRHFMLAEFLNASYAPPDGPPEPRRTGNENRREAREFSRIHQQWKTDYAAWERNRKTYTAIRDSMARHLVAEHDANEVTLVRREHRLFSPTDLLEDNLRINDSETYRDLPETPPRRETLPWIPLPRPE